MNDKPKVVSSKKAKEKEFQARRAEALERAEKKLAAARGLVARALGEIRNREFEEAAECLGWTFALLNDVEDNVRYPHMSSYYPD